MALEPWLIFSILAAVIWAVSSVIDKVIIPKYVKTPIVPLFIIGIFNLVAGVIVALIVPSIMMSEKNIVLSVLAGMVWGVVPLVFFSSLLTQEVSRISSLFSISPLLVLIFATVFLGEVLSYEKYLGIISITAGSILITLKLDSRNKISINTKLLLVVGSTFLIAISQVLAKFVLSEVPYWNFYSWYAAGFFLSTLIITMTKLSSLSVIAKMKLRHLGFLVVSRILGVLGLISLVTALSFGLASLVSVAFSIQSLFILVFAFVMGFFNHHIEKFKGSEGLMKFIAVILIVYGVFLIS